VSPEDPLEPLWRAEAAKSPDPHGLAYYIRRAENLLAGLIDTKESLTLEDRALLERHLAPVREIAAKPDPWALKDKRAVYTFIEIISALSPRFQTLRDRARNSSAAKARAIRDQKKGFAAIDALITEHCRPGISGTSALRKINAELEALKRKPLTLRVLYSRPAWKKKRPSNRASKKKRPSNRPSFASKYAYPHCVWIEDKGPCI
jgi:hypothetical protein